MNDNFSACRGLLTLRVGVFHDQQSPGAYFMLLTGDAALVKALAMVFSSPRCLDWGRLKSEPPQTAAESLLCPKGVQLL